jgi:toxin ParE1/3/4
MKLRYERGALADLDEIFAYIAQDNPAAAARLVAHIEEVAARIAGTPFMGEATRKSNFRRFPVGNYLVVYEVGQDEVIIHYVRHGARQRPWKKSKVPLRKSRALILSPRRPAICPRIVGAFATAVLVQHHGAGVAHDVGVGLAQNFDLVAGVGQHLDQIAVEARFEA